jgi:hypothetical protein
LVGGNTLQEIIRALPAREIRSIELRVGNNFYRTSNLRIALNALIRKGIVISEKHSENVATSKAARYKLLAEVYPKLDLKSVGSGEAQKALIERYVKAFGPVTEEDVLWWSGLNKAEVKNALMSMEEKLLSVKMNSLKWNYLMLKADFERFISFGPVRTPSVLLLPYEDPYTKGYKVRDRIVEAEHLKEAYPGGEAQPTILLNGKIVGLWNRKLGRGREPIRLHFFERCGRQVEKEAVHKAKVLGNLLFGRDTRIEISQ